MVNARDGRSAGRRDYSLDMPSQTKPRVDHLLAVLHNAKSLSQQLDQVKTKDTSSAFKEALAAARSAASIQVLSLQVALRAARNSGKFCWSYEPDELDDWVMQAVRGRPPATADEADQLWELYRSQAGPPEDAPWVDLRRPKRAAESTPVTCPPHGEESLEDLDVGG